MLGALAGLWSWASGAVGSALGAIGSAVGGALGALGSLAGQAWNAVAPLVQQFGGQVVDQALQALKAEGKDPEKMDPDQLKKEVERKIQQRQAQTNQNVQVRTASSVDKEKGIPMWIWFAIGGGVLGIVLIFFLMKR